MYLDILNMDKYRGEKTWFSFSTLQNNTVECEVQLLLISSSVAVVVLPCSWVAAADNGWLMLCVVGNVFTGEAVLENVWCLWHLIKENACNL